MSALRVHLFGGVQVFVQDAPIGSFPTRAAAGLFAYLALNRGRLIHRDTLAGLFWPEVPDARARKALRNALWRVRSLIEPPTGDPAALEVDGQCVGFRDDRLYLDVAAFEALLARGRRCGPGAERAALLAEAVPLYRGDFMSGHDYEWCGLERERLRLALLATLESLMDEHMAAGQWARAVERGHAITRVDPLREAVHRRLMVCHYRMGERPLAVRQYRSCARVLRVELGIEPMAETERLHRQIEADALGNGGGADAGAVADARLADRLTAARVRLALERAEAALAELRSLADAATE